MSVQEGNEIILKAEDDANEINPPLVAATLVQPELSEGRLVTAEALPAAATAAAAAVSAVVVGQNNSVNDSDENDEGLRQAPLDAGRGEAIVTNQGCSHLDDGTDGHPLEEQELVSQDETMSRGRSPSRQSSLPPLVVSPGNIEQVHYDEENIRATPLPSTSLQQQQNQQEQSLPREDNKPCYMRTSTMVILAFFLGMLLTVTVGVILAVTESGSGGGGGGSGGGGAAVDTGSLAPSLAPYLGDDIPPDVVPTMVPMVAPSPATLPSSQGRSPVCGFHLQWRETIQHSDADLVTLSDEGGIIVVARVINSVSTELHTTVLNENRSSHQVVDFVTDDAQISGDGSTLILSSRQSTLASESNEVLEGVLLVLILDDSYALVWNIQESLISGPTTDIHSLTVSFDGSTVATVEQGLLSSGNYNIQIHQRIPHPWPIYASTIITEGVDSRTKISLSGNGQRLFISGFDGTIQTWRNNQTDGSWVLIQETRTIFESTPTVVSSYSGTVLVATAAASVSVVEIEFHQLEGGFSSHWGSIEGREDAPVLDFLVAISETGETVFGCEVNEDSASARLYERSGREFVPTMELLLEQSDPTSAFGIREISLQTDGEGLLVVFADNEVALFKKTCW